jgi:hypothetical protein
MVATLRDDTIHVAVVGSVAKDVLRGARQGRVLAVFRRTFYVRFDGDLVCLGPIALRPGPLNALYAAQLSGRPLRPDATVVCNGATLTVDDRFEFAFAAADVWKPPAAPPLRPEPLRIGLRLLAASTRRRSPGGFGALLSLSRDDLDAHRFAPSDPLLAAALPTVAALRDWIASALAGTDEPPPAVDGLIGLGGGLTPSGDDFLCGAMTALHYFGHRDVAARIAAVVLPLAERATSLISAAYLRCASAGEASSALFDVLEALQDPDHALVEACLDTIDAIGHTSGWDCLAGAAAVCAELTRA